MFTLNTRQLWLTVGVLFSWYGNSCQTDQVKNQNNQSQNFELEDSVDLGDSTTKMSKIEESKIVVAHPAQKTSWHTRKLIMSFQQPPPALIIQCKEFLESAALKALRPQEMQEASIVVQSAIEANPKVYHWCFYQLAADLDLRLERESPLLTEKSITFTSRMRVLWVAAATLDRVFDKSKKVYSDYVRTRYMEISQNHFGRKLEIMDPFGVSNSEKAGKPASSFQDEP